MATAGDMDHHSSGQRADELLERIWNAVNPPKHRRSLEMVCAIILALATTASAWCAYQSKLWGGVQAARANAAIRAGRDEAVNTLAALQARAFDASMFIAYMQARVETNRPMEAFLSQRFRPDMKRAVDAWFRLDPLNDPAAPPSPLHMAEYRQKEADVAARHAASAAEALKSAREARQVSDDYILLTVLFASVLFFGGIARAFDSPLVRRVLGVLAVVLFLVVLAQLVTLPVCRE